MWGNKQKEKQVTISAYELEVIQKAFTSTLSWLEFYIENSGYSGDWQRQTEPIKREDLAQSGRIKGFMETALLALDNVIENKPDFIAKKFQDKFYSWLDKSGINVNNCSKELTQSLIDIYNVLNNQGKEFSERTSNEAGENISRMTPEERRQNFYNTFTASQKMMEVAKARQKELEGKTYRDVEIENQFSGDANQGKQLFSQIQGSANSGGGDNPPPTNLNKIIQDVKANPQNWKLDEIPTEIDNFGGARRQEVVLFRRDARLHDFDQGGKLNFNGNPIYRWENFNVCQRFEIKQSLKISIDYLTNEEIKWVVREFKDNPRVWRIGEVEKQTWLINGSSQITRDEIGTLIHNQQNFSKEQWAEIKQILARQEVINKISQGDFTLYNVNIGGTDYVEQWYIHNSVDTTKSLIFDPNAMYKVKDLTEAEKKAIGYKSEQRLQSTSISANQGDSNKDTSSTLPIVGAISFLLITTLVVAKKSLSRKIKKS